MHVPQRLSARLRIATARLVVVAALVVPWLAVPAATAHNVLISTTPAASSSSSSAPSVVALTFEEPPLAAGIAVAVTAPSGVSVVSGTPTLNGVVVVAPLSALTESGAYRVAWRVVADDGHPVTGTFTFTLALASASGVTPSATALALTTSSAAPASDATPWLVMGAAVLVAGIAGSAIALRRRAS